MSLKVSSSKHHWDLPFVQSRWRAFDLYEVIDVTCTNAPVSAQMDMISMYYICFLHSVLFMSYNIVIYGVFYSLPYVYCLVTLYDAILTIDIV